MTLHEEGDHLYSSFDLEGPIFFEGQAVALLPVDPSLVHPLMDGVLYRLLRACPQLSLVLAIPASFLAHSDPEHRMSWGRRLVRRLWAGDTTLSNRIRMLPHVVGNRRMMELLRLSDLALDTFPVGSSPQVFAYALGVGTPVVCLDSGVLDISSKHGELELRGLMKSAMDAGRYFNLSVQATGTLPWRPSVSVLSAFYKRHNLSELVASSAIDYAHIAERLSTDKEYGYSIRVRILEVIDSNENIPDLHGDFIDLERFIERTGAQYAHDRANR